MVPPLEFSQAAINLSLAKGLASRKVFSGVLPKHHRPWWLRAWTGWLTGRTPSAASINLGATLYSST